MGTLQEQLYKGTAQENAIYLKLINTIYQGGKMQDKI